MTPKTHLSIGFARLTLSLALVSAFGVSSAVYAGTQWSYGYNELGLISSVDGPRTDVNDITRYEYNARGQLTRTINALGHRTELSDFDARGLPTRLVDPNGMTSRLSYHPRGWLQSVTRQSRDGDITTLFEYDAVGLVTSVTRPDGSRLFFDYDDARRLVSLRNDAGQRIDYTLDAMGNRTREEVRDGSGQLVRIQSQVFDELGRLLRSVGAEGVATEYRYDRNSNPTVNRDALFNSTDQAFDALNRLVQITDAHQQVTELSYDSQDNLTQVIDARGNRTQYHYNGLGQLIEQISPDSGSTTYQYDDAGNIVQSRDARAVVTEYRYDALNRLIERRFPDSPEQTVSYQYDASSTSSGEFNAGIGYLTGMTRNGESIRYRYDDRGHLIEDSRSLNGQTYAVGFQYDPAGRLSGITYPDGRQVNYQRNALGLIEAVTINDQPVAQDIQYQPFGPLAQLTYGNGLQLTRQFDQDYRLNGQQLESLWQRNYHYDITGQIRFIDEDGGSTGYDYDGLYRLTDANSAQGSYRYDYDALGNRTQGQQEEDQTDLSYAQDSNRLLTLEQGGDLVTLEYDDSGNIIRKGAWNYVFDSENRLTQVLENGSIRAEYHYNPLGQREQKSWYQSSTGDYPALAAAERQQAEAAEAEAQQLTEESETARQAAIDASNKAQQLDAPVAELLQQQSAQAQQIEQYEAHLQELNTDATFWLGFAEQIRSWSAESWFIPEMNWLADMSERFGRQLSGWADEQQRLLTSLQAEHDSLNTELAGLQAEQQLHRSAAETATQQADALALQAQAREQAAQAHRALAEQYAAQVGSGETEQQSRYFIYDQAGQLLVELDGNGNTLRQYVYLGAMPLAMLSEGAVYYYHNDHLNTPKLLTDGEQQVVWKASHSPFGQAQIEVERVENPLRFPGQYFDQESGLHYNYYRDYDPRTGRYIQSDPIGLQGGLNTYGYVGGNPLLFVDPLGLITKRCARKLGDKNQPAMPPSGNLLRHDYIVADGEVFSFQAGSNMLWSQGRIDNDEHTDNKMCEVISEDPKFDEAVKQAADQIGAPTYAVNAYPTTIQHIFGARNCQTWADDVLDLAENINKRNNPLRK